ncbi:MAG TPA: FAD binding domain-containing protein [Myxococcota bacterium]|nr:FAD binding domain-containing protein [Myxococcota bacterium]
MRGNIPAYDIEAPSSLSDALQRLADEPGAWTPFAGGTDLMVVLEMGRLPVGRYLSILGLPELDGISVGDDEVRLGANTTYREIRDHAVLADEFPMLVRAAIETGAIAIQNRGTLGGNIMNASPAADSPPALLAYDASVELVSVRGTRRVRYEDFHTGYKQTVKQKDELLSAVVLPRRSSGARSNWLHHYEKVGTRSWQAISKVCFAGLARVEGGVVVTCRVGLGAVQPVPALASSLMAAMVGQPVGEALVKVAQDAILADVKPIDDIRSTAAYRARVARNLAGVFARSLS